MLLDAPRRRKWDYNPKEFKVVALRECPTPEEMQLCDTPDKVAIYWRTHFESDERFNPECESFGILFLNTRRRVKGHQLISIGTLDTVLVTPREIFRAALILGGVSGIVLAHNHPSGDPAPSDADIKVTRDLIRAGQLLKIEVLDHVIVGTRRTDSLAGHFSSLRQLGFFSGA